MRKLQEEARLFVVWLFILCAATTCLSQTPTRGVSMQLSVSSTNISESSRPVATITIRNQSGSTISMGDFHWFRLELQLKNRPYQFCRIDECYTATLPLGEREIDHGRSHSFVAKLSDFYWHNSISSITDSRRPKNLFWAVSTGEYDLIASLSMGRQDVSSEVPTYFTARSNSVSMIHLAR
jgi:hypothetical protein